MYAHYSVVGDMLHAVILVPVKNKRASLTRREAPCIELLRYIVPIYEHCLFLM